MKTQKQLIQNVIGQLQGVAKMMDDDKGCFETLIQMKAAKAALVSAMNKFLQDNFLKCLSACNDQDEVCKKFFTEILKNN